MEKNSIRIMYSGDRQIAAMRHFFPKCAYKKNGEQIVFYVRLKVHEKIPEYKVKIIYQGNIPPKVYVVYPEIIENAKHTYSDKSLCLYHYSNFKWTSSKLVANEIMRWTAAWIYFYEYWLQTGKWIAKEVPHTNKFTKE